MVHPDSHKFSRAPWYSGTERKEPGLFPPGTEMVHFPGFASPRLLNSAGDLATCLARGCPIRKSPDRSLFAAPRGLSQLATSFIASLRQGIHRPPLVA